MVSGSIALMVQANPKLTPAQAKEILEKTAAHGKAYPNNNSGYGRINVKSAVSLLGGKPTPAPVKDPVVTPQPTYPSYPYPYYPYPSYPYYPYPGYAQYPYSAE
jgi:serine protease AprX